MFTYKIKIMSSQTKKGNKLGMTTKILQLDGLHFLTSFTIIKTQKGKLMFERNHIAAKPISCQKHQDFVN